MALRGDELPERLRTREGRRAALKAARERLEGERAAALRVGGEVIEQVDLVPDPERFEIRPEGRQAWLRQARRDVEARRQQQRWPVPRSRQERLVEAKRRLAEELAFERAANDQYERHRATARDRLGRKLSSYNLRTKPYSPPLMPEGKINVSDPDSWELRTQRQPNVQGYNAQAVVTEQQIIAAEITNQSPDFAQLEPMVTAALRELESAGVSERPRTVLIDAGGGRHTFCVSAVVSVTVTPVVSTCDS